MQKSAFIKFLDELFKKHSFVKKGTQWSCVTDNIIKIIKLTKSKYGDYYYINYGYIFRNLELDGLEMHIFNTLSSLDDLENDRICKLLDFDTLIADEDRKNELEDFIKREILFKFSTISNENDIVEELKKRSNLNDIPLIVKNYLNFAID